MLILHQILDVLKLGKSWIIVGKTVHASNRMALGKEHLGQLRANEASDAGHKAFQVSASPPGQWIYILRCPNFFQIRSQLNPSGLDKHKGNRTSSIADGIVFCREAEKNTGVSKPLPSETSQMSPWIPREFPIPSGELRREFDCELAALLDGSSEFSSQINRDIVEQDKYRYYYILHRISRTPKHDINILDIGTSPLTILMKRLLGANVWTVDLTSRFRTSCIKEGIPFGLVDITRQGVPFKDVKYNYVLFLEVIEHLLANPTDVLSRIKAAMTTETMLFVSTPNFNSLRNVLYMITGKRVLSTMTEMLTPTSLGWGTPHFHEYTFDELVSVLTSAGFKVVAATWADYWDNFHALRHSTVDSIPAKLAMIPYILSVKAMPKLSRGLFAECRLK